MKQVIHFKVRFLRENALYWVYYGILTKTKVRECQHIGMSGGIGLFFYMWFVQLYWLLREVKGKGWVDPEAWSQADTGFTVAWLCHALPGCQGHRADISDVYVIWCASTDIIDSHV